MSTPLNIPTTTEERRRSSSSDHEGWDSSQRFGCSRARRWQSSKSRLLQYGCGRISSRRSGRSAAQQPLSQLHQRSALVFNAVEVVCGHGNIYHEHCLLGELVGQYYHVSTRHPPLIYSTGGCGISAA